MYRSIFLLLQCIVLVSTLQGHMGYFCVPVADLVAEPCSETDPVAMQKFYDAISISPERGKESCIRKHQGIFNEQVAILDYKNSQYYVELTNCFYQPVENVIQPVRLWAHADSIVTSDELKQLNISTAVFPEAYSYSTLYQCEDQCITIMMPWYNPFTDITYCAGTRFVVDGECEYDDCYMVMMYNRATKSIVKSPVPKNITCTIFATSQKRRKAFVNVVYSWCSDEGFIPFVWGGTSYTKQCNDAYVELKQEYKNGEWIAYWDRPLQKARPITGFDASGLILRAAQICGIPYYCVNSTTVLHTLPLLGDAEILQEGDVIWAPGYVALVGSLEDNELIEAQGYSRGYGKVHVIQLHNRFAGIKTWDDFMYNVNNKIPFESLDSKGNVVGIVPTFKVFKLPI